MITLSIDSIRSNAIEAFPPLEPVITLTQKAYTLAASDQAKVLYRRAWSFTKVAIALLLSTLYWIGAATYALAVIACELIEEFVQAHLKKEPGLSTSAPVPEIQVECDDEVLNCDLDHLLDEIAAIDHSANLPSLRGAIQFDYTPALQPEWIDYLNSCGVKELRKLAKTKGYSISRKKAEGGGVLNKQQLIDLLS
jgi:hypothetical protein